MKKTTATTTVPPPKPVAAVVSDVEEHSGSETDTKAKPAVAKKAIVKYTEEELATLKTMGGAGKSFEEIAAALPGRLPGPIKTKLEGLTMGLIDAGNTTPEAASAVYGIPAKWIHDKIASREKAKLHPRQTKKAKEAAAKKAVAA